MDQKFLLSEFDRLISDGLVLYDDKQTIRRQLDGGLKFQFVLTSALNKKPTAATAGTQSKELVEKRVRPGSDIDANGYEVGEVGGSHVLVANKFCYARPHYLLLTKDGHRRQYERLDRADLAAAWTLLSGSDLDNFAVFFNCGKGAGYSRLHKHMQLMPMPPHTFASFLDSADGTEPEVPFRWFYERWSDAGSSSVDRVVDSYRKLLKQATSSVESQQEYKADDSPGAACSHNVIMTSRWIVVIPRRRPSVRDESGANAMGMLGYIAVPSQEGIDTWADQGLCNVLRQLGVPI
ncbi:ATP adenylyltransferase [Cordyceps fumosorosea ARSEF 2679]|uniref:ATP adenylyltransferase n=1 Tax=Cordyceps fumosorosea (strain ARSEF 2679) TaxID=1081104 RepID=A0A162MXP0_CORFA|nr:ATP adenylyltransferase [Cordyceps fumosorosea ARSEF 2679]OAA72289.1 ATP adenylyltransferase [Cordyceps fumosorosea ARSEF 2679]